ncbi:Cytochrome d ubiquinol oxidase subunit II OS=Stutzerimonas stutzeri OX=316 GN=cydB PE=3 SV=1 [Stutzerimonas stutzeri]
MRLGLLRAIRRYASFTPFLLTLALIFLGYSGLGISLLAEHHPAVGEHLGRRRAAAEQGFTLVGALLIIR